MKGHDSDEDNYGGESRNLEKDDGYEDDHGGDCSNEENSSDGEANVEDDTDDNSNKDDEYNDSTVDASREVINFIGDTSSGAQNAQMQDTRYDAVAGTGLDSCTPFENDDEEFVYPLIEVEGEEGFGTQSSYLAPLPMGIELNQKGTL